MEPEYIYVGSDDDDPDMTMVRVNLKRTASLASIASTYPDSEMDRLIADYQTDDDEIPSAEPLFLGAQSRVTKTPVQQTKRAADDEPPHPNKKPRSEHEQDDSDPFVDVPTSHDQKPYHIISHHDWLQKYYNTRQISFAAQFEIARLLTSPNSGVTASNISIPFLDKLKGMNNVCGAKIVQTLRTNDAEDSTIYEKEREANSPWREQDLEDERMSIDPDAGLGFFPDDPGWFAGKATYRARLKSKVSPTTKYEIILEKAELGPSSRITRKFGSRSLLRLKIPKLPNSASATIIPFLKKAFILNERVYRAFYEKDRTVFLMCTNEGFENGTIVPMRFPAAPDILTFIEWHNSIKNNEQQTMTKWASRFALGLSNSAPGLVLKANNIKCIRDHKSPLGSDMTDGAGLANIAALSAIQARFNFPTLPTAVQIRLNGCKGLICRKSNGHRDDEPEVTVRPSMIKIRGEPLDLAHCIVDVLRVSHVRIGTRLSAEVIINLAENGVPLSAFKSLFKDGLEAMVEPFKIWEGSDAMLDLWRLLCRHGGVMSARAARHARGMARLKGYGEKKDDDLDEDEEDDLKEDGSTAWWADETSGQPSVLEETVMYLLGAGFTPQECPVLRDKLRHIVKSSVLNMAKQCRVDVPMSATAFIIPDEDDALEPGEIFFKSSERKLTGQDGLETDIIIGDILLTRHPCKLPSDVRKWKAVDKPCLRDRTDVIIMSTRGERRMADYLSGGDYDGDKGLLIWQPQLVDDFKNSSLSFSEPPKDIENNFSKSNETVAQFLQRASKEIVGETTYLQELQEFLLGGLKNTSVVGSYSNMHDVACYTLGYADEESKRLAYMFCMVLDGSKTGLKVKPEVLKKDQNKYRNMCHWKHRLEGEKVSTNNVLFAKRTPGFKAFIMDQLLDFAQKECDQKLAALEKFFLQPNIPYDEALAEPWMKACERGDMWRKDCGQDAYWSQLHEIEEHVKAIYNSHKAIVNRSPSGRKKGAGFTNLSIETRQDLLRRQSLKFAQFPSVPLIEDPDVVKASYAYVYDAQQCRGRRGWSRFPWDVAMRHLCSIKAKAVGQPTTISGIFYEHMKVVK